MFNKNAHCKQLVFLLAVIVWACQGVPTTGSAGPTEAPVKPPKKYTINLDLPPEHRWDEVARDYKDDINDIHIMFNAFLPKMFPLIEELAVKVTRYLPHPYNKEIEGIARELNVSVGIITMANLVYDVSAFCTSVVARDSTGNIWHARNLDYPFIEYLKYVTVELDFEKNGTLFFSTVGIAGYVGVFTGLKPGSFTISGDQRNKGSVLDLLKNILVAILYKGAQPSTFLIRKTLERSSTYDEAVSMLSKTDTYSPIYYIIGGLTDNQGAVITRDRITSDVWTLDDEHDRWFEVETNYDHWKPVPARDPRRTVANKAMQALGPGRISEATMYNVISTYPVLNNSTLYSVVMSASKLPTIRTWMRV